MLLNCGKTYGSRVRKHADCPGNTGDVASRDHCRLLIINSNLEFVNIIHTEYRYLVARWAPVYELDRSFSFHHCDGVVNIFGRNIATIQKAYSHIFSVSWITLDHLLLRLEAGARDVFYRERFVKRLKDG